MGRIIQKKNNKTTIYTVGEDFNSLSAETNTYYLGVDNSDGELKKKNPDNEIINIENSGDSRPYRVYTALLTQSGTDAPVVTVLENTLGGNIVWTYVSIGNYNGFLENAFTANKTFLSINNNLSAGTNDIAQYAIYKDSFDEFNESSIFVNCCFQGTGSFESQNYLLVRTSIEIRVYN